jgi:hypothetical protein
MMKLVLISTLMLFAVSVEALTECQVAALLRTAGFPAGAIPAMVCVAKYESGYSCSAKNFNSDGTEDFGLFQINSRYWCSGGPKSE